MASLFSCLEFTSRAWQAVARAQGGLPFQHAGSPRRALRVKVDGAPEGLRDVPMVLRDVPMVLRDVPMALRDVPMALRDVPMALHDVPRPLRGMASFTEIVNTVVEGDSKARKGASHRGR